MLHSVVEYCLLTQKLLYIFSLEFGHSGWWLGLRHKMPVLTNSFNIFACFPFRSVPGLWVDGHDNPAHEVSLVSLHLRHGQRHRLRQRHLEMRHEKIVRIY